MHSLLSNVADLDPQDIPARLREVNAAYLGFDRSGAGAEAVLERKFSAAFWRRRFLADLVAAAGRWSPRRRDGLADALVELRVAIPADVRGRLAALVGDRQAWARVLAAQGERSVDAPGLWLAAGPGVDLKIQANRGSSWSFEKWRRQPVFSEYAFRGDGVIYRGLEFRPGDVLLSNVNLDGNGLYTTLADPKTFCSHSALFAILEHDGRRFPSVLETYEKGVRPVPLNVFLNPRFSAYTEVYRPRGLVPGASARVNAAARQCIDRVEGYNFDTEDPDGTYLSCTSVPRTILAEAGLDWIETKSALAHPRIQANLARLGYEFFRFFAPVDYLLDPGLECVGWVDNHHFPRLLTRELVETRFRELFAERVIEPARFPFMYPFNLWGIGQIRRRTPLGRLISKVEGFDHVSLPKGPDRVLAVITLAEAQLGAAIVKTHPLVEAYLAPLERFDLAAARGDPALMAGVRSNLDLPWLRRLASAVG